MIDVIMKCRVQQAWLSINPVCASKEDFKRGHIKQCSFIMQISSLVQGANVTIPLACRQIASECV